MAAKGNLWKAELLSYKGIAPGAYHYQVNLFGEGREIHCEWTLDKDTADRWNIFEERKGGGYTWRQGMNSNRWDTETSAIQAAIEIWEWLCHNIPDSLLVRASRYSMDRPEPVLAGNEEHAAYFNDLRKVGDRLGWYDGDRAHFKAIDEISKTWMSYCKMHFNPVDTDGTNAYETFVLTSPEADPTVQGGGAWCTKVNGIHIPRRVIIPYDEWEPDKDSEEWKHWDTNYSIPLIEPTSSELYSSEESW